jgi:hypothetical protein
MTSNAPTTRRPTVGEMSAAWEAEERAEALADLRADITVVRQQFEIFHDKIADQLLALKVRLKELDEDADKLVADEG